MELTGNNEDICSFFGISEQRLKTFIEEYSE